VAATTDKQWAVATSWVGSEAREVFDERYNRLGDLDAAIEESLRAQLTAMTIGAPSRISVEDISVDYSGNISALQKSLEKFLLLGSDGGTRPKVTKIVRPSYR
jgi:hypothetical protein